MMMNDNYDENDNDLFKDDKDNFNLLHLNDIHFTCNRERYYSLFYLMENKLRVKQLGTRFMFKKLRKDRKIF